MARKSRKTYPAGGGKVGKKGLTQTQARYLFASPTLTDTGALKSSITEEEELFSPMEATSFVGASLEYIATHEEGGSYDGHEVPARPSQFITEDEDSFILRIFKRLLSRA
jgi:phage gpG-like protein